MQHGNNVAQLETTVFRGTNFEPSCGLCLLLQNFYVFAEFVMFYRILRNLVLASDMETNVAYFCQVQEGVENYLLHVDAIVPSNT